MKVIKRGRPQKGWSTKRICTGNGNGGGGCGGELLVEEGDLYYTYSGCLGESSTYVTFTCDLCGVETDVPSVPPSVRQRIHKNKTEWLKASSGRRLDTDAEAAKAVLDLRVANRMNVREAVDRALREDTLLDSLVFMAVWEGERAIDQAMRFMETGERTGAGGASWDTCYKAAFQSLLGRLGLLTSPFTTKIPNPRASPPRCTTCGEAFPGTGIGDDCPRCSNEQPVVPFQPLAKVAMDNMTIAYDLLCLLVRTRPDLQVVVDQLSAAIETFELKESDR